jgi:hypothetical protein
MQAVGYEVPAKVERRVTVKAQEAPLINPSKEDAERLQAIWNAAMEKKAIGKGWGENESRVRVVSQEWYSERSKGDYGPAKTVELDSSGTIIRGIWRSMKFTKDGTPVCRIRVLNSRNYGQTESVLIIEAKPGKALPLNWEPSETTQKEVFA